jgi:hypothetical protein
VTKVYIAGPMAGIEDGNRQAFKERAEWLRLAGYEPVNPWDIEPGDHEGPCIGGTPSNGGTGHQYGCNLRADIVKLMFCDAITFLPGWENSKGASTEHHVAQSIGIPELGNPNGHDPAAPAP